VSFLPLGLNPKVSADFGTKQARAWPKKTPGKPAF